MKPISTRKPPQCSLLKLPDEIILKIGGYLVRSIHRIDYEWKEFLMTNSSLQRLIKEIRFLTLHTLSSYRYLTDKSFQAEINEKKILSPKKQLSLMFSLLMFWDYFSEEAWEKLLMKDEKGNDLLDFSVLIPIEGIHSFIFHSNEKHYFYGTKGIKLGNVVGNVIIHEYLDQIILTSDIHSLQHTTLFSNGALQLCIIMSKEKIKIDELTLQGNFIINPPTALSKTNLKELYIHHSTHSDLLLFFGSITDLLRIEYCSGFSRF